MAATAQWQLVATDLFDREAAPHVETSSSSLQGALAALWFAVLHQGVQDDGQPTFTAFEVHTPEGRRVALPRDPLKNPELARLRARLGEPSLCGRLAELQAARVHEPFSFAPYVAMPVVLPAPVMDVVRVLAEALGANAMPTATGRGWQCGERVEISTEGLRLGNSFESAQTRWVVKAEGLDVTLTDVSEAGWYLEVTREAGAGASVLRDALASAGLC